MLHLTRPPKVNVRSILLSASITFLAFSMSGAALFERTSGATQTSLIELYTSEGCSSCPPAERWLTQLTNNPQLWHDFVPVSFHVDYWDGLGWPDRFARKEFTQRQYAYSAVWKASSVYTPGFVLDGREWLDWRSGAPAHAGSKAGVLSVKETSTGRFVVAFSPADARPGKWSFAVAVLGFGVTSDVKRGENSGRRLSHDFVVLAFERKEAAASEATFELKPPVTSGKAPLGLAAWVGRTGEQAPLQSVGGWWQP